MKDLILSVVVGVIQVFGSMGAQFGQLKAPDMGRLPLDWRGYALLLVGPVAIAMRRRFPVPVLLVTMAATCGYLLLDGAYGPVFLSPVIVVFGAVLSGRRLAGWLTSAAFFLFAVAYATWLIPKPQGIFHHSAIAAYLLLTLTIAEFCRSRRERLAERDRVAKEEARRQASEERLTMARELHDVLAHNISLIHVQASTALHILDDHPEQARTALTTIKQASKDVLTEMRGVISLLRDGAPRSPMAGMSRLRELTDRSGLTVTLEVTGDVRTLPAGIDRAGYRIVQESLTNVARHAPGSAVDIRVTYGFRELAIVVEDDGAGSGRGGGTEASTGLDGPGLHGTGLYGTRLGSSGRDSPGADSPGADSPGADSPGADSPGADSPGRDSTGYGGTGRESTGFGGGNGIPGMRERATALGGSLSAGLRPGGGFRVAATLPLPPLPTLPTADTRTADTRTADAPAGEDADPVEPTEEHK